MTDMHEAEAPADTSNTGTPEKEKQEPKQEKQLLQLTPEQLAERLKRKEEQTVKGFLDGLGLESQDQLKEALSQLEELRKAQMTEEERKQKEVAEAQQLNQKLAAEVEAATTKAQRFELRLRAYEAMSQMEKPFADPAAALQLTDLSKVLTEDGEVDAVALAAAIEETAQKYPWALKKVGQTPPLGSTTPQDPQGAGESDESRRRRFFGGQAEQSGFFSGGGVRLNE